MNNVPKLYFKITNEKEKHHGFQYCDGLNVLTDEFNDDPKATCVAGGFYFTDAEHILEFLVYGIYLREVMLPTDDPDFKIIKDENKWRANKIILGKKRDLNNVSTFQYLIDQGADIHIGNDNTIIWASGAGYLEIVQFLISKGANIHADNDSAVKIAFHNGHSEVVRFLISEGANMNSSTNNYIIKLAQKKNIYRYRAIPSTKYKIITFNKKN